MKKTFLTTVFSFLITLTFFAQDNIWVKIPNYENKKEEVNQNLSPFGVTSIVKTVPASRNPKLQDLYQIDCNCDENDLLYHVSKNNSLFVNPEIGPKYEVLYVPNDYSTSVSYDYSLELINAQGAWDITRGDSSILISITDAGYRLDNYELYPKMVSGNLGFNGTNPDHGTAVATTAAGNTNNGFGKSYIGYNSSLDLRGMNYNAILEATYAGAKVINASWAASCFYSQYAQDIINEAFNNGSVIVAAAGNGSTCNGASNLVYPASFENVISVTSIGPANNHERFIGNTSSTHQHNNMVDICAPGYDVYLTTSNGTFLPGTGSSFAAPLVSGTIALMLSVNPCLTPTQVETILKSASDTTLFEYNQSYKDGLGSGRLDAAKAVEMAKKFNTLNADVIELLDCETHTKQLMVTNLTGEGPYTIEWSNGDIGENCYVMWESGEYEVYVKDSEGCSFYDKVLVEPYEGITINVDVTNVTCNGDNNGEVVVTTDNSNYSYVFISDDNSMIITEGNKFSDLHSGIYWLLTTDEFSCLRETIVFIDQPEQLQTTITTNSNIIDLTVMGGTAPYTYEWYSHYENVTTEDIINPLPGFYQVYVTDSSGCQIVDNVFISDNTVGLTEIDTNEFEMYPNPSYGAVTIKTNKDNDCDIVLTNISNQNVIINHSFTNEITLGDLSEGVYLVTIENTTKRLLVK